MKLLILAKAPRPGRSKTRLCPPCTPDQAAMLAEAALEDTLLAVKATPGVEPVLVLDGDPGPWLPAGVALLTQRGGGLDERLTAAFEDSGGPAFLVGMDTPQLSPTVLAEATGSLMAPGVDIVLGPAEDGGWWGIGQRRPDPRVFLGVRMSSTHTLREQRARLVELELNVRELATLRDVDTFEDALSVASAAPASAFARAMASLGSSMAEEPLA